MTTTAAATTECNHPMVTAKNVWRCIADAGHEPDQHYYVLLTKR